MKFTEASKVLDTIQAGDEVARIQGENRARINNLFNGAPPLDECDAENLRIEINVNFGEAPVLGQHGRRQYNNAFLSRGRYFKVSIPDAPVEKAVDWSAFITRRINRYLKRSRVYYELHRSQWASVLLHGVAPKLWYNGHDPIPKYVALSDCRFPTDSLCSLENLNWFSVRKYWTEGELSRAVFGPNPDPGWQKDTVGAILSLYHDQTTSERTQNYWMTQPEKMAEAVRQNGGYYSSDAVPTIPLWHFFYLDEDRRKPCWKMRVVPDQNMLGAPRMDFLFDDGDTSYADKLDHFLHVQFGDLNNDAPFKIHSVRSMGFLLMEPVFWSNLTQCRSLQHLFEHMNAWLRISDPAGRARAQKIDLFHKAIVEEGVSVVPQTERHQIDPNLLQSIQLKLKELQNEASVSYTQDTNAHDNETATGVMARVTAVNAMMSGLLSTAYNYEVFAYEEICRRFCISKSANEDVRRFQKDCLDYGIPRRFINVEYWDVDPEIPIGGGNPTMEMAQVQELLKLRPMMDPTAQQEVLHEAVVAFTDDPKKAERWVPLDKVRGVTDAQEHAELAFSTLMLGVPVRQREGLSKIDQIETLIGLMAGVIQRIERTGNMATQAEIIGLQNSAAYTGNLIQQFAQDDAQKDRAKQYSDVLGKLMNAVKGFAQRLAQMQKAGGENGNGAETAAKIQSQLILAGSKAKISEAKAAQTQQHKQIAFESDQRRKDASTLADMSREAARTHDELERQKVLDAAAPAPEPKKEE